VVELKEVSTVDLTVLRWRKSSFSGGSGSGNDNCVEVAFTGSVAALRDSKNTAGPVLVLPTAAWKALLADNR
jgi:hypothetical protein